MTINTAETTAPKPSFTDRVIAEIKDWAKFLAWAIPLWFAFTTAVYAMFVIPSESMVPTLQVGDRISVSKWSYGYSRFSLPFSLGHLLPAGDSRLFEKAPNRGDVVVFMHPLRDRVMIKRLVGIPGDTVELREGRLYINGNLIPRDNPVTFDRRQHGDRTDTETVTSYIETLPGGLSHTIHEREDRADLDTYGPTKIPEGRFLMMGDNRDNSTDGRSSSMGLVPFEYFIGKANTVLWTTHNCRKETGLSCGQPRLWKSLTPSRTEPSTPAQ
jgi:signal peptidase I